MFDDHIYPNDDKYRLQPDSVWTVEDVSSFLRITEYTVRKMACSGRLPGIKVGRSWRFLKSDILAFFHQESNSKDE